MAGGGEGVGVEEAAQGGVIISALEVIKFGLGVVDIATVAQGVMGTEVGSHGSGDAQNIAPGIIDVCFI